MGGTCSLNNQDKVLTWRPLRPLKVPHILCAPHVFPHVLLSCPAVDPLGILVVCLSWSFSQTPDLSASGSIWLFLSPEPLCTSFFQKAA